VDPLEQAILDNASDLGTDPGVELEAQLATEHAARKVQAPQPMGKAKADLDPSIAEIDRRYGFDDKAIEEEIRGEALAKNEEENNKAIEEFLKKKGPEWDEEGRKFGLVLKDLVTNKDAKGEQGLAEKITTGVLSTAAAVALVPGKWLEGATNMVGDIVNSIGRKYNWGGGSDVLGQMEFFKAAQAQLPNGQVAAKIVEYAAPSIGLVSKGAGLAKATAMGAAINYAVVDPDDQRLADMAKGTWLEKIPLMAETIDYLTYDPTDSNLTKRWKNALEGAGVDLLVGAGFDAARSIRQGAKADVRAINDAKDPVEKIIEAEAKKAKATPAPTPGVVPEAPPVPPIEANRVVIGANAPDNIKALEAELEAAQATTGEAARAYKVKVATEKLQKAQESYLGDVARAEFNSKPEVQAAYMQRADEEVAKAAEKTGVPITEAATLHTKFDEVFEETRPLSNNAEYTSTVARIFKAVKETPQSRGPMTLADMYAMGGTLAEDIDFITQVAGREMGDLMHAEGTVAVKTMVSRLWEDFAVKAKAVTNGTLAVEKAALAESFENLQRMGNIMAGYSEEAARTLGVHKHLKALLDSGDPKVVELVRGQMASKIVLERISQAGGIDKIKDYAKLVEEVEALVKATDYTINSSGGLVAISKWAKLGDGIVGFINTNRLNSVSLMGRIASSNTIMTGRRLLTSFNESVIGGIIKAEDTGTLSDVAADINGMMAARAEAASVAAQTWKTGKSAGPTVNLDFDQIKVAALPELGSENIAAKAWNTAGTILASGRRGIMTLESATGIINYRGYIAGAAERAAGTLKGAEREAFIKNFLENTPQKVHEAAVQAVENINLNGAITTPWIEAVVNPASDLGRYHPITMMKKLFLPFGNTRGRFLEEAMTNVPGLNLLVKDNKRKLFNGTRAEKAQVMAEMATGMETIGIVGYLIHNGVLTGGTPPDYKTQKLLADSEKGWKPYSVRVGDKFVEIPFADQTLKKIIDVSAYAMASAQSAHTEEADHGEWLSLAGMAVGHILSPDDNLRTAGQLTDVVKGYLEGQDMGDQARSIVASPMAGAVPMAGVMRDYNLAFGDNTVKDYKSADGLINYLKLRMEALIPGLSEQVPPSRNIFGDPVLAQSGTPLFGSFLASQDVEGEQVTENLRLLAGFYDMLPKEKQATQVTFNIQEPRRSIEVMGMQVKLTPLEYEEFSYEVGKRENSNGQDLKAEFYDILVDKNSAVFDYVREHGYGNPGDAENFRHMSAAITANYKARQDAIAMEFAERPEIQERANDMLKAQDESVRRGYQTLDAFGGNNVSK